MGSGITRQRAPHAWPACGLRATFLVVLGLGGLAGCAPLTEVATHERGQSLDGVRQEVAQLRTETAQLGALFRVVEDGVWARDATLVQLDAVLAELDAALAQQGERLQVLEQDVPLLKRPSGRRGPLLAMDVPSALNRLAERLSAVERRLATLEGAPPELSRPPAPAGSGRGRPSGHRLQVGMSPDAVRAQLGVPVSVEETPDFVFWHYGPEQSVVFRRDPERVQGWLGFTAAHLENAFR
jgi:hypothetical protein